MKRVLALVFLLLLLLTGCAGTPQSRESGATAVVSVLGVEPARAFTFWRLRRAGGRRSPSAVTARGRPRPLPWRA